MLGKKLINSGPISGGANTFASENFNTVLYTGNGGTQRIGGYINKGAVFNGSSSYITIPIDRLTNTFSLSVWLFADDLSTSYRWVFGNWNSTSQDIYIMVNSSGTIEVNPDGNNGTTIFGSSGTFTTNTWHHLAVSMNAGAYTVYFNGSNLGSGSTTNTTFDNGNNYQIGKTPNSSINEWSGKMDQFRLFDKAISSSEVTTLYGETFASTTISTTDIFDDNSGVALYQLDGNANDTGGVSGKFGSAAIFNGSSSKIDITGFSNFGSSGVSISAWVNVNDFSTSPTILNLYSNNSIVFGINSSGNFFRSGQGTTVTSTSAMSTNTWHNVVLTADTSGNVSLYLDGSAAGTGNSTTAMYNDTNQSDLIGAYGTISQPMDGRIDEVRIYSDVLTSTEVGYIYNNTTASIPTDNLLAYYKLNGNARDEQQLYDGTATNVTYAYDGTASNVTYQEATKFTPDLVWIKARTDTRTHSLLDTVRGASKIIQSESTAAEWDGSAYFESFDSNGFTVKSSANFINNSSHNYVAWCFNAGTNTAAQNNDGTQPTTVKANQDAGFSIVEFTSPSSGVVTLGTGLTQQPKLIISKVTNTAADWPVFVDGFDTTDYILLNSSAAKVNHSSDLWNLSNWSNTTFGCHRDMYGTSNTVIAYCFHDVTGYQKIGTYDGTGASGNMVETGFEPAFLLIKQTNTSGSNWNIIDNKRDTENPRDVVLWADTTDTESTASQSGVYDVNFLSNGFSLENTYQPFNASGGTYIYLAIAADPDTTTPTVADSFDVVTYTGSSTSGTGQTINFDFNPDLVITKSRTTNTSWAAMDTVRGAGSKLRLNLTSAELDNTYGGIKSFNGDGSVTFEGTSDTGDVDYTGRNYVAYAWKAGDHDDNLPEINTNGTIDSTVSVNDAAGFSIVKWTGTGANATVGHGLSSAPEIIIVKRLTTTGGLWCVYSSAIQNTQYLTLHTTNPARTPSQDGFGSGTFWNETDPTSTVFSLGTISDTNSSGDDFIAYCWYSVSGHSKIGSYTGNGTSAASTQTINVGFKPRFVMIKNTTSSSTNWVIIDSLRDNADEWLYPNQSSAAYDDANTYTALTSTGFILYNNGSYVNTNNDVYIYLAFK